MDLRSLTTGGVIAQSAGGTPWVIVPIVVVAVAVGVWFAFRTPRDRRRRPDR